MPSPHSISSNCHEAAQPHSFSGYSWIKLSFQLQIIVLNTPTK
jgi:hypothetical protein